MRQIDKRCGHYDVTIDIDILTDCWLLAWSSGTNDSSNIQNDNKFKNI